MDVILLAIWLGTSLGLIALSFYKSTPYLGVTGGLVLILLGIFVGLDAADITQTFCVYDASATFVNCTATSINGFDNAGLDSNFGSGVGWVMALAGVGVIVDSILGFFIEDEEFIPQKDAQWN